ncbi:MAG: phosphoribosylformylglycinamidine cyclo-ligase [Candidatus Firestonebacteria bacterium]|nr:phosphoribosylformylglycinamidine cyclo-ligase [Candidatus Firestonebacteria bacterium]
MKKKKIDAYAKAGVNIDAGNEAVRRMKAHVRAARTPQMLADIGSFGGLFQLPAGYQQPVLVGSTDGVGTKLLIAGALKQYHTVGQDLVNHCVNDILVQGAVPLFFMDYFATGKLQPKVAEQIVKGLSIACRENGCALLGGETAEMPGLYQGEDFDLAGTIVGIVEKKNIIDGRAIKPGDVLLGLPSSGLQTNGYSLARQIFFKQLNYKPATYVPELKTTVGEALLRVHRSFLPVVKPLLKAFKIKGMAHITGGGFIDNLPRILPENRRADIRLNTWPVLPVFQFMQERGNIDQATMFRTFNMGIGMILVVGAKDAPVIMRSLREKKEAVYRLGEIAAGPRGVLLV